MINKCGASVNPVHVKQKQFVEDGNVTLSGVSFTIDNVGDNNVEVKIGGNIARTINANEQFVLDAIPNAYYHNIQFEIQFVGTGTKQLLIWYPDYKNI